MYKRIGVGLNQHGGTGEVWDMCLCLVCSSGVVPASGWVGWHYVCVCCESGFFV